MTKANQVRAFCVIINQQSKRVPTMLGYMTEREASQHGVTHHGSYYGIPTWMGDVDSEAPLVFAKWAPLDLLIGVFSVVEGLLFPLIHGRDAEPCFMFKLKGEISRDS